MRQAVQHHAQLPSRIVLDSRSEGWGAGSPAIWSDSRRLVQSQPGRHVPLAITRVNLFSRMPILAAANLLLLSIESLMLSFDKSLFGKRAACLLSLLFVGPMSVDGQESPPNIIFVLADDLGWAELSCYGNEFHETPNLDRLASQGVRYTSAYAAAPVCSPYRAALLTGQYPARLGIVDYLRPDTSNALDESTTTLAEQLRSHGYQTGMIGKWHLSGYAYHGAERESLPRDHGFDWNVGREVKSVGNGANTFPYVFRDQPISWIDLEHQRLGADEYLTDRLNQEAVDFIRRSHDRPFFLLLSHYAPHSILNGRADLVDKYREKHPPGPSSRTRCYLCQDAGHQGDPLHHWASDHNPHLAAMLETIDDGVGMIDEVLTELEIASNTIVIFSSDNGGETNVTTNAPLRGGKSQLYEGGIRVPLIVRWPNVIEAGQLSDLVTVNTDFYPTLLEAIGFPTQGRDDLDGVSLFPHWQGEASADTPNRFWHYPLEQPHFLGGRSASAVRHEDWKLIEFYDDGSRELYHLQEDPGETRDLAGEQVDRVERMTSMLQQWREELQVTIPQER